MGIRLVALDLDDSLLRQDLTISQADADACQRAARNGVRIVLASGRTELSMRAYALALGALGPGEYLISYNGARILDLESGGVLYESRMAPDLCRRTAALLLERGFPFQFYMDEGCILTTVRNRWTEEDSRLTGLPIEIMDDPSPFLDRGQLKFVVAGEPQSIRHLRGELTALLDGQAEVLISKPYFLEVLAAGTDKGTALEILAERLNIPMAEVLAVGDAQNDLGMVRKAGFGCAPFNAIPSVQAAARYVSPRTHEQDAVAEILERFVLGG
ncbi:MAG TPA: Cof-type HAD-IIB family hydrolase [Magnetospirillaceae bacterium]|nr:Cof-type HAD-IIB family hydrolase [Magnetospirillaceae bacterium]